MISATSSVVAYWSPSSETACQNVTAWPSISDWLIQGQSAHRGVTSRFQPSGDGDHAACGSSVGLGACDPHHDGAVRR